MLISIHPFSVERHARMQPNGKRVCAGYERYSRVSVMGLFFVPKMTATQLILLTNGCLWQLRAHDTILLPLGSAHKSDRRSIENVPNSQTQLSSFSVECWQARYCEPTRLE